MAVPAQIENRPGLPAIAYRIGTHAEFKASLLARLSSFEALRGLRTRSEEDLSIALLDAWAMVADILTFYSQYLANQSYIRTADERLSVRELARLIGYRPAPGVAATAYLAFTMDETPGSPARITLEPGTKVQSTPGPDETAQTFETVEPIEARRAWNAIRPRLTKPQVLAKTTKTIRLQGIASSIQPGAAVVYRVGDKQDAETPENLVFATVTKVEPDQLGQTTTLTVTPLSPIPLRAPKDVLRLSEEVAALSGPAKDYEKRGRIDGEVLESEARTKAFEVADLFSALQSHPPPPQNILVFHQRTAIFGHNAPDWNTLPEALRGKIPVLQTTTLRALFSETIKVTTDLVPGPLPGPFARDEDVWPGGGDGNLQKLNSDLCPHGPVVNNSGGNSDFKSASNVPNRIFLDRVVSELQPEQFIVLNQGAMWAIYKVDNTTELTKSCFMITAKITQLNVDSATGFGDFKIRTTSAYVQSERWPLAPLPEITPIQLSNPPVLELNTFVGGLQPGQRVVLSGREVGGREEPVSELLTVDKIEHNLNRTGNTGVTFTSVPDRTYVRSSLTLNVNVALATHGETVTEVLGSGNTTTPYQTFALRQPPVTHVPAATASGALSTLGIRVNDIRWHEVPFLFGRGPRDRVFSTHTTDSGETVVRFGNGTTGSLLPTGQESIRAVYRRGIGLAGLVRAGQLNMLLSRPLGLHGVSNPLPSEGAEDPESLDDTRQQAPMTVRTLDRTVSLQDYEDFARSYEGIAKAQARWVWNGREQVICLTVAGPNGAKIQEDSVQYEALLSSLKQAGDPFVRIVLKSYRPATFLISASVKVHEDYLEDLVVKEVEAALRAAFSFAAREFGQPAPASEVIAVMQAVSGVVAVDVDSVKRTDAPVRKKPRNFLRRRPNTFTLGLGATKTSPELRLAAFVASRAPTIDGKGQLQAAELVTLDPRPLDLQRMA